MEKSSPWAFSILLKYSPSRLRYSGADSSRAANSHQQHSLSQNKRKISRKILTALERDALSVQSEGG
jgi:hypothetical protein